METWKGIEVRERAEGKGKEGKRREEKWREGRYGTSNQVLVIVLVMGK